MRIKGKFPNCKFRIVDDCRRCIKSGSCMFDKCGFVEEVKWKILDYEEILNER